MDIQWGVHSSSLTFNSGGVITVEAGGYITAMTINSGATEVVYGSALNTYLNSGGIEQVDGSGKATSSIVSGGAEYVSAQGAETGALIEDGGYLSIANSGLATSVTITSSASALDEGVLSAAQVSGGTVSIGAVAISTSLVEGGAEVILAGGSAAATQVSAGGFLLISSGGTAGNTTVLSGGTVFELPGAITSAMHISSGAMVLSTGAALLSGDTLISANPTALSGLTAGAGERFIVLSGGILSNSTIAKGSAQIDAGGRMIGNYIGGTGSAYGSALVAGAAAVNLIGSNGIETVASGGSEFGTTLAGSNAVLNIQSGASMLAVSIDAGVAIVSAGGSAAGTNVSGGVLVLEAGAVASNTDLLSGGALVLQSLAFASGSSTALLDPTTGRLTVIEGGTSATEQLSGSYSGDYAHASAYGSGGTEITIDGVPCYCRGTLIRTEAGEVAVENLAIGDRVINRDGTPRPIRWIGQRAYDGRFIAGDRNLLPIRFLPGALGGGALGGGAPQRDLYVSPLHAMFIDGLLIPAWALVNGVSIRQLDAVENVEYFHVELETHDVIWAEGAASESFIDDGSRGMFQNAHEFRAIFPDAPRQRAEFCAPRIEAGEALVPIRRRLAGIAAQLRIARPQSVKSAPLSQVVSLCIPAHCRALPLAPAWDHQWIIGLVLDGVRLDLSDHWLDSAFDPVELASCGEARHTKPNAVLQVAPCAEERWVHLEAPAEAEILVRWGGR